MMADLYLSPFRVVTAKWRQSTSQKGDKITILVVGKCEKIDILKGENARSGRRLFILSPFSIVKRKYDK